MLVGKIYDEALWEKRVSNGEVVSERYNVTIQLQYDELMCYMFANIIQACAISSHVHDFPDTFCARYYGSSILPSPQYYELLMKKEVTRTKVHLRAALKYCLATAPN